MKILHVLSGNLFTGAVEHAIELCKQQIANGDKAWLMTDAGLEQKAGDYIAQPISNRKYAVRLTNILAIRRKIKELKPDVIHAHSRAASWVAKRAVKGTRVALVSTVHGRQHVHYSSKKFNDYGEEIIAVSEEIRRHLIEDLSKDAKRIHVIHNALSYAESVQPLPQNPVVSLIGRLSGPKGEQAARLFREVFPILLRDYSDLKIILVGDAGGGAIPDGGDEAWAQLAQVFPDRVERVGFVQDVQAYIDASSVVIGAGRVALRALASGRQLLALGECGFCGLIDESNFEKANASNFGDTCTKISWNSEEIITAAQSAWQQAVSLIALSKKVRTSFNLDEKCKEIKEIYKKARMRKLQPKWIPVLMYHKVPENPIDTPHRIFVTRKNFQKHMGFLSLFGRRPVRMADYFALRNGEMSVEKWPKHPVILTFDDGYVDNLNNALPVLKAKGWTATLFALADRTQKENFWDEAERGLETSKLMNAAELQIMKQERWEIGAHTFSHCHLPNLSDEALKHEVAQAGIALSLEMKTPVLGFAYPYGDFSDREENAVRRAGYAYAVATDSGALHLEDNLFRIFRVNIFPEESIFSYWKKTSSWYRKYYFRKRGR